MSSRPCPVCGWTGEGRNVLGGCSERHACRHRLALGGKGRPRSSRCECIVWPCPCVCHHTHPPEIWLAVAGPGREDRD